MKPVLFGLCLSLLGCASAYKDPSYPVQQETDPRGAAEPAEAQQSIHFLAFEGWAMKKMKSCRALRPGPDRRLCLGDYSNQVAAAIRMAYPERNYQALMDPLLVNKDGQIDETLADIRKKEPNHPLVMVERDVAGAILFQMAFQAACSNVERTDERPVVVQQTSAGVSFWDTFGSALQMQQMNGRIQGLERQNCTNSRPSHGIQPSCF